MLQRPLALGGAGAGVGGLLTHVLSAALRSPPPPELLAPPRRPPPVQSEEEACAEEVPEWHADPRFLAGVAVGTLLGPLIDLVAAIRAHWRAAAAALLRPRAQAAPGGVLQLYRGGR